MQSWAETDINQECSLNVQEQQLYSEEGRVQIFWTWPTSRRGQLETEKESTFNEKIFYWNDIRMIEKCQKDGKECWLWFYDRSWNTSMCRIELLREVFLPLSVIRSQPGSRLMHFYHFSNVSTLQRRFFDTRRNKYLAFCPQFSSRYWQRI